MVEKISKMSPKGPEKDKRIQCSFAGVGPGGGPFCALQASSAQGDPQRAPGTPRAAPKGPQGPQNYKTWRQNGTHLGPRGPAKFQYDKQNYGGNEVLTLGLAIFALRVHVQYVVIRCLFVTWLLVYILQKLLFTKKQENTILYLLNIEHCFV